MQSDCDPGQACSDRGRCETDGLDAAVPVDVVAVVDHGQSGPVDLGLPPADLGWVAPDRPTMQPADAGSAPEPEYHVVGSEEGAEQGGGGTAISLRAGVCVQLPLQSYRLNGGYGFGSRVNTVRVHAGEDVMGAAGTQVYAVYRGRVRTARRISTWGTLVEIDHVAPDGTPFVSLYGHLRQSDLRVAPGTQVETGALLGALGSRSENGGWAEHLHFAVFTGTYPATGVLAGHVPMSQLADYDDPVPFLEAHGSGSGCGTPCVGGAACPRSNPCERGQIDCAGGAPVCVQAGAAPVGTPCPGGACDGQGSCRVDPCLGVACGPGVCRSGACVCPAGVEGPRCERCASGFMNHPQCTPTPPREECNGLDDDGNGVIDDPGSCWRAIYRFVDSASGARCWSPRTTPPAACAGYRYEIEAFVVASGPRPGAFLTVQCSRGTDHILIDRASGDRAELAGLGYNCTEEIGYLYRGGAAPTGQTPVGRVCPLWRYRYNTPQGGAHLFTRGADNTSGMTCEAPSRGEVFSTQACFGTAAPGC